MTIQVYEDSHSYGSMKSENIELKQEIVFSKQPTLEIFEFELNKINSDKKESNNIKSLNDHRNKSDARKRKPDSDKRKETTKNNFRRTFLSSCGTSVISNILQILFVLCLKGLLTFDQPMILN